MSTTSVVVGRPDPNQKNPTALNPPAAELTPADVMGNPDCIMEPGSKHGRDLAIIVVPGKDGSRFAVVDQSGVVFGGSLPFHAAPEPSFARRQDGSVLRGNFRTHAVGVPQATTATGPDFGTREFRYTTRGQVPAEAGQDA